MDSNIQNSNNKSELPLVSIVMPTHNGAKRISRAIMSVQAQAYQDWELVIVDDGSVDNVAEVIKSFSAQDPRIFYYKNEQNLGIQKTLNHGIAMANGEFIARLDDDDLWNDTKKLERQMDMFAGNHRLVLVGTGAIIVDENGTEALRYLLPITNTQIRKAFFKKNCFIHSSVVFKKSVVLKLGGYDETKQTRHVEDYDLWLRMGKEGQLANVPEYSVTLTKHDESISSQNKIDQLKKNLRLIRKYKREYPGFRSGYMQSLLRVVLYRTLTKLHISSSDTEILKVYKRWW